MKYKVNDTYYLKSAAGKLPANQCVKVLSVTKRGKKTYVSIIDSSSIIVHNVSVKKLRKRAK